MQATIEVDDDLYRAAEALAAREGRTLAEVVEDALREAVRAGSAGHPERPPRREIPTFRPPPGEEGLMPGFTWENLVHEVDNLADAERYGRTTG